jgi:hypothetical protein
MSSDRKFLIVFCILMVAALFPAAGTVCANQIPLGYVSYDPSTANLNTFSVNNFPVQTSLQIQNATLTLTDSSGIVDAISLGTIGPGTAFGGLFDPSLFSFTSAVFQGTLDLTTVSVLATDGVTLNTLQLDSNISVNLAPSLGNSSLQTGDFALMYANTVNLATPEPGSFFLVLNVFLLLSSLKIAVWLRRS